MSYTDHNEIVNDALHALLIGEYGIPVEYNDDEFYNPNYRTSECIRYYMTVSDESTYNSDGEDRVFNYVLEHYFNHKRLAKKNYEKTIWERENQTRQLLAENRTYQPSNTYKWHDLMIETSEVLRRENADGEQLQEKYIKMEISLRRFCQWA